MPCLKYNAVVSSQLVHYSQLFMSKCSYTYTTLDKSDDPDGAFIHTDGMQGPNTAIMELDWSDQKPEPFLHHLDDPVARGQV
jgi:hypothetical protein